MEKQIPGLLNCLFLCLIDTLHEGNELVINGVYI